MAKVQTLRGPIDVAALGRGLMHEHVSVCGGRQSNDLDKMFVDNPRRHFEAAARRFAQRR